MDNRDERVGVRTYLTNEEAKEFHKLFIASMAFFTLVAVIAHFLVWQWRPWLQNTVTATAAQTIQVEPAATQLG